jgi:KDO2-lipid IV(A) lauroyltransferase
MKRGRKVRFDPGLPKGLQDFLLLLAACVIRFFIWLTARLPEDRMKSLVRVLYRPCSWFNRRVCRRNLAAVFESFDRNPAQLDQFLQRYLAYMVRFQVETARCFSIPSADLEKKVLLQGENHLREALKKGGGILLVSGHMGTWWHLPIWLASRGHKVNVVFNSFPPPIEHYLEQNARLHGISLAFVDRSVPAMMRQASRQNEIVFLTFDISVRRHHPNWLPFGRTKININPGPAILARRHHIPAHFVSISHGDARRSHAIIHPEASAGSNDQPARSNDLCRAWVDQLYSDILIFPEQWWGWGFSDLPYVRRHS